MSRNLIVAMLAGTLVVLGVLLLLDLVEILLRWLHGPATMGYVSQLFRKGETMITGVVQGAFGNFHVTWNGAMTAGQVTVWTVDVATVVLTPTGDNLTAAVAVGEPAASFTLTATGTSSNGSSVTATASVPVLAAAATGGTIDQV